MPSKWVDLVPEGMKSCTFSITKVTKGGVGGVGVVGGGVVGSDVDGDEMGGVVSLGGVGSFSYQDIITCYQSISIFVSFSITRNKPM